MATTVASRFAVLAIDDDGCKPNKRQKETTSVKQASSKNVKNDIKPKKEQAKKEEKKKSNKNKKKKNTIEHQQWEQWKEKDVMHVEEVYEQQLHEAILLSKLAYEAKVENGGKDQDPPKKNQGTKKKKSTMSLDEFNNMGSTSTIIAEPSTTLTNSNCKSKESDIEFFERMDKETKEEIIKNKEKDMFISRLNTVDDDITMAQLRVEVEKRDEQIQLLEKEVQSMKTELSFVKERNRKLYQILAHGEMKDKASVLAEVANLQAIRDELTSEVSSLHAQLEQERSKTRASSTDLKASKQSNKKKTSSENA